jgi:short-subunit dehydrogenase
MVRQRRGHIVNTASVAGLIASPGQGSYTATKHAVVAISKALRVEAKHHGVRVSALCPGVIRTPILSGGKYGRTNVVGLSEESARALWEKLRPMDADVFARKALQAVARNEAIIVIPGWWKALWLIDRLAPSLTMALSEKTLGAMRKNLEVTGARPRPRGETEPAAKTPREGAKETVN